MHLAPTERRSSRLASPVLSCSCTILRRVIFATLAGLAHNWRSSTLLLRGKQAVLSRSCFQAVCARQQPTPATPSRLSDTNSPRTQHRPLHVGDQPYKVPLLERQLAGASFSAAFGQADGNHGVVPRAIRVEARGGAFHG